MTSYASDNDDEPVNKRAKPELRMLIVSGAGIEGVNGEYIKNGIDETPNYGMDGLWEEKVALFKILYDNKQWFICVQFAGNSDWIRLYHSNPQSNGSTTFPPYRGWWNTTGDAHGNSITISPVVRRSSVPPLADWRDANPQHGSDL
jgi:hypothetical protein